ncbi:MAG: choice-of-anchor Q domain-containing protein [Candidatus Promineifilaceae bacterium]
MVRLTKVFIICMVLFATGFMLLPSAEALSIINICYVDQTANGSGNGLSWTNAFTDVQTAIDATSCTELWVAQGIYTTGPLRTDSFEIDREVTIYGGFNGGELLFNSRNADPRSNGTVLSGNIGASGIVTDNAYHVLEFVNGAEGAVVDGVAIEGGYANGSLTNLLGGGVYATEGQFTLRNVLIRHNNAASGGGFYSGGQSGIRFENVTFLENEADDGGGARIVGSGSHEVYLERVTFAGNSAYNGGGISTNGVGVNLMNAVFVGNEARKEVDNSSATGFGGGIYHANAGQVVIQSSTFAANSAENNGSAIRIGGNGHAKVINSLLADRVHVEGNQTGLASFHIWDSLWREGSCSAAGHDYDSVICSGISAIGSDPGFISYPDPSTNDYGNLYLTNNAAPVDAGNIDPQLKSSAFAELPAVDRSGQMRVLWDYVDIGAFEGLAADMAFGLNSTGCAYPTYLDALAAAAHGDKLYVRQQTTPYYMHDGGKQIEIIGSNNSCDALAIDPVVIDFMHDLTMTGPILTVSPLNTLEVTGIAFKDAKSTLIQLGAGSETTLGKVILDGGDGFAGGAATVGNSAELKLLNSEVNNNRATTVGGAIKVEDGTLRLVNVKMNNNRAGVGGAIALSDSSVVSLQSAELTNNHATSSGGAIYASAPNTPATITFLADTKIGPGNTAVDGAGIYLANDISLEIGSFAHILQNTATGNGGGIYLQSGAQITTARDTRIWQNAAANGGGVYMTGSGTRFTQQDASSDISENTASLNGGGFYVHNDAMLTLRGYANYNVATEDGGGIAFVNVAAMDLAGVALRQNRAHWGGGISAGNSTVQLNNITLDNNEAKDGGGIALGASGGTIVDSIIENNHVSFRGGGIYHSGDLLDVVNTIVRNNQAVGTDTGLRGTGGGFFSFSDFALDQTSFTGNEASGDGGGVTLVYGTGIISNSTFISNTASYAGGGISVDEGVLNINDTRLEANDSEFNGGGIQALQSSTMLTNTVVAGNVSGRKGGGVYFKDGLFSALNSVFVGNQASSDGGGIFAIEDLIFSTSPPKLNISYSTIAHNVASNEDSITTDGGGVYVNSGVISTFTGSIFWGNSADRREQIYLYPFGATTTMVDNLVSASNVDTFTNCITAATCSGVMEMDDPLFTVVPNSGDGDWTTSADNDYGNLLLQGASPAVDSTTVTANCPVYDIRNVGRSDYACDLGAYELLLTDSASVTQDEFAEGETFTFGPTQLNMEIVTLGTLQTITVTQVMTSHPEAEGLMGNGLFYRIKAEGSGFELNLTLPHNNNPDPQICRYDTSLDAWDCSRDSFNATIVTRNGVTQFSDWAVTDASAPVSVGMSGMTVATHRPIVALFLSLFVITVLLTRTRQQRRPA